MSVAPFTGEQIAEYVSKWFALDAVQSAEQRAGLVRDFLRESVDARDLCANPLMLSLLCALYSSTHYFPRNRPEIYERCAELLFVTWDQSRDIEVPHRFSSFVRPAVQRLAWQLFTDSAGRQALPREELSRSLAEYLATKRFEDRDEALQAAEDFLDFCAGRAWVLTDVGTGVLQPQYGFVHRTFLEYFAASQLVKSKPDPEAVWAQLRPHIGVATWSVVAPLAVQILDRTCESGADSLIRLVVADADVASDPGSRIEALAFAARLLETVAPGNRMLRTVVERSVFLACAQPLELRGGDVEGGDVDAPLAILLRIGNPENYGRITRAVADAVAVAVRDPAREPSGGMVHASLTGRNRIRVPLADRFSAELGEIPDCAQRWHRCLELPSVDSVRVGGFASLFDQVSTGWNRSEAQADWLLEATRHSTETEAGYTVSDTIVLLYPEIVARFTLPGGRVERSPILYVPVPSWRQAVPQVRAVALLLLVAGHSSNRYKLAEGSHSLVAIVNAHAEPAVRAMARRALVDLNIPAEAHALISEWIEGRVPVGGANPITEM